jgi:hypothetical protein
MDNNNIMDTNNNIMDTNNNIMDTNNNIKSIKKKHSFKKKKKTRPILSQHGGAKYDFDNLIGIDISNINVPQPCWFVSTIQLLWNIDCLRDYLLETDEDVIRGLNAMTDLKKQEEEDKEKERITKLLTDKKRELFKKKQPDPDKVSLTGVDYAADTIDNKVNMILALQSIFKVYKASIDKMKKVDIIVRTEWFTTPEINRIDELKKNNLVAILDDNTVFKSKNGTEYSSIETINSYVMTKTGTKIAEQKDAYMFMELIFLLFEDIDDNDILNTRKCFTCRNLYMPESSEYYTIASNNAIKLDTVTTTKSFQNIIDNDYINHYNNFLILFPETKFILLLIVYDEKKNISNTITISNRTYILRGCIVHIKNSSGHLVFVAYNDNGDVAALLNDSVKSELLNIKNNDEHPSNDKKYDPATNGIIFLYERSDELVDVSKDDPAKLAASLAGSLAVARETKPASETDIAAALTATLAGTQFDPTDKPGPPLPTPPPDVITPLPPVVIKPPQRVVIKPPQRVVIKPPPGGDGDTIRAVTEQQDGSKEIKPYNASLDIPSGESNGENMVLGILLVITLAITGVLFVQR